MKSDKPLFQPPGKWIIALTILALVGIGCSGGGGDGSNEVSDPAAGPPKTADTLSGVFTDSPVQGLAYRTPTQTGVTDAAGTFHYMDGETVSFHLGDLTLGNAPGRDWLTPVDLVDGAVDENHPAVTNIIRFLQTLDTDGEPVNGIHIPGEVAEEMNGRVIDFMMDTEAFEHHPDVERLVDDLGRMEGYGHVDGLVPAHEARDHMRQTLVERYAGHYEMEYGGDDAGTMAVDVHPSGAFSGSAVSHLTGETHMVSGSIHSDGTMVFDGDGGFTFDGHLPSLHDGPGSHGSEITAMGMPGGGPGMMPSPDGDEPDPPMGGGNTPDIGEDTPPQDPGSGMGQEPMDDDDPTHGGPGPMVRQGVFVDSPVSGIGYHTPTRSGVTDAYGTFHYLDGEMVTFHMGDIVLGEGPAAPVMTPIHLIPEAVDETHPAVVNMIRFMQSLDADGDPENGIHILNEFMEAVHGYEIDFSMPMWEFENDPEVRDALALMGGFVGHGPRMLISSEEAQDHFRNTMMHYFFDEDHDHEADEGWDHHGPGMMFLDADSGDFRFHPGMMIYWE